MQDLTKRKRKEFDFVANSEIGFVSRCPCCDSYSVNLGGVTLNMKINEIHSLFCLLLKTLKLNKSNLSDENNHH